LGAATGASAFTVQAFGDGSDTGTNSGVINLDPGSGAYTLNVWATWGPEGVLGTVLNFAATGSVTITAPTLTFGQNCLAQTTGGAASCLVGNVPFATQYQMGTDSSTVAIAAGTYRLATITLNVGPGVGSFVMSAGSDFVDDSTFGDNFTPSDQLLVNVVPEPGTLLLLATGLSGLVMAGRSRN
jgi:hypothetical protein